YYGLGDFFVFFFFGWIPVGIAYFTQTHHWDWLILLPSLSVGLLSTAVLNLNNLRDIENDKNSGKRTIIVKMGIQKGKIYHFLLILFAFLSANLYTLYSYQNEWNLLYLIAFIPLFIHLKKVTQTTDTKTLDPELKKVAMATVLLVLLWVLSFVLSV
nr:1,4-dihydroxy-2-naphthoate octaprenyltransferase [Flavobacteriaceae bacterium]